MLSLASAITASASGSIPTSATVPSVPITSPHVSTGCQALRAPLGDALFMKNSAVYKYEAGNFWSNTEIMAPGCVFRPRSSRQLAEGIGALVGANAEFAVRGGGHMGIRVGFC